MEAVYYNGIRDFKIANVPIPEYGDDEILIKVTACGVCGTDSHVADGEFICKFPLIPGHELVGRVEKYGKNVKGYTEGDRVVVDPGLRCGNCYYCRRGKSLFCENFENLGLTVPGGFADYTIAPSKNVFHIKNLSDIDATLVEPAACALHGADVLALPVGSEVLVLGAGPTGLILSQILKLNGAAKVVLAANKGIKTEIAKTLDAADEYLELDRANPQAQWEQLKKDNPYGFDAVVEATGAEPLVNDAINYVRRGGTLMVYGVYDEKARVHWPPAKIFGDEIRIVGSFAQVNCFPRAIEYLDTGKVKVKGMVTDTFAIKDFQQALDKLSSRGALKVAITSNNYNAQ